LHLQELVATCQEQIERCIDSRHNAAAAAAAASDDDDDDDASPGDDSRKRPRVLSTVVTPTDVRNISLDR